MLENWESLQSLEHLKLKIKFWRVFFFFDTPTILQQGFLYQFCLLKHLHSNYGCNSEKVTFKWKLKHISSHFNFLI